MSADAAAPALGGDPVLWVLVVVGGLVGLYFAFRNLRLARIIEDTPTARIRSAPQGYIELEGEAALQEEPLPAPLTGTPCCWFRYKVERRRHKGWRTLESDASTRVFLLTDETGICVVHPRGAEVTATERKVWYGTARHPRGGRTSGGDGALSWLDWRGQGLFSRYRYTEERIHVGDRVYAVGKFHTRGEMEHRVARQARLRDLLRGWKRSSANLNARFDRDGDGQIDAGEWELARESARRQAAREVEREEGARLPHSLSATGSRDRPFLISNLPQFDLVRRYRRNMLIAFAGFLAATAIGVWLLVRA